MEFQRIISRVDRETFLLGYFGPYALSNSLRGALDAIDSLPADDSILPFLGNPSLSREEFLQKLDTSLEEGMSFVGDLRFESMHQIEEPNFFSKKTVSGWHSLSYYDLGEFTGKEYFSGKYAIVVATQMPKYDKSAANANDPKEAMIQAIKPDFAISPVWQYFKPIMVVGVGEPYDQPIDRYAGDITILRKEGVPLGSLDGLTLHSVTEFGEDHLRVQLCPFGSSIPHMEYKALCDALGKLCLYDLPFE